MKKKTQELDKSDQILSEVRRLGVVIEDVESKVDLVAEQHGEIIKKLDAHTEMIGNLAVDMQVVKSDIELIKSGLRKKVDVEEFEVLEKRVAALEKRR